ncbi:MAG: hypothetical protein LBD42_03535 [Desulfovibrio sp.]|jgi:tetratricopeptide (TPR) repeat protein|nr:hypothetical protein [Desulfovibrio sp.]
MLFFTCLSAFLSPKNAPSRRTFFMSGMPRARLSNALRGLAACIIHTLGGLRREILRPLTRPAALALLIIPCLLIHAPTESRAAQEGEEFIERRGFSGLVQRHMAERAARTAAELAAMDHAIRLLAKEPDIQFANDDKAATVPVSPLLDGLARMLFATPLTASGMQGFPPDIHAVVHVKLVAPEYFRKKLHTAMLSQDIVELYGQILAVQRSLLARYDAVADILLPLRPLDKGGREEAHVLQSIMNEMAALDIFISILPMYEQHWKFPLKAQAELQKAHSLAPKNPLILVSLAEVLLQLDRAPAAMERVGEALRINSQFARAHDVKGAILLRQRLPALAAESFGRAIALSPHNPAYLVHRASAHLVLENEADMCADFQRACAFNDCEGLQWAKNTGKCSRAE